MNEERLRIVVYQSDGWWTIHGLDHEFVTVAKRLEDVPGEIQRWLAILFAASRQLGVTPFHGYSPAPRRFWEMYERAAPWADSPGPMKLPADLGSTPLVDTRLAA